MSRQLFKSTSLVAVFTLSSRILGFIRDVVLAQIFGAGATFDAFVIAFKIPNFLRRLFAEGAFAQAFVPVLAQYREQRTMPDVKQLINHVSGVLAVALLLVILCAEIIAPLIIMVFAPGFFHDAHRFAQATSLLRIVFPYLGLIGLTAFAGAVLNTYGKFAIPAATPNLLNLAMIISALLWAPHMPQPIYALAWGVIAGGVLQLSIQLPFLWRLGLLPKPRPIWRDEGVKRILTLMVPALFGVSVAQLSILIDNGFASFLPHGSISWLYYSDRITFLPLGVIGVALSTVVMPHLSRQHSRQSHRPYTQTLDWALRWVVVIGMPAAVGLLCLAGPILSTLIQHGAFTAYDVIMTRKSLMAFSLGLPGFMLVKILASGFYAKQNMKTPVKVAAIALVFNFTLNCLLIVPLKHAGLALATSMGAWLNAMGLLWLLRKRQIYQPSKPWIIFLLKIMLACALMAALILWLDGSLPQWHDWSTIKRIERLALAIVSGIVLYFVVLWILRIRLRELLDATD